MGCWLLRVWICLAVSGCAIGGFTGLDAPALAMSFHRYEAQVAELPEGPVRYPQAMTTFDGKLYVTEELDGHGVGTNQRVDSLAPSGPTGSYEFTASLPAEARRLEGGIALGEGTGETELYLGEKSSAAVAVFGFGGCGGLQCASLQHLWSGAGTPSGSFVAVTDVAVDQSADIADWARGDVFVLDDGAPDEPSFVDIYEPAAGGGEPAHVVAQLTGVSPSEPFDEPDRIAVSGFNGDLVVQERSAVDLFEPSGLDEYIFVRRLQPPSGGFANIEDLAIDGGHEGSGSDGEIYVATASAVFEFGPGGEYRGEIGPAETPEQTWSAGNTARPTSIAVDPSSHRVLVGVFDSNRQRGAIDVFGPDVVTPDVDTGPAEGVEVQPASHTWRATLTGTVNPLNEGPATCRFAWGTGPTLEHAIPCTGKGESSSDPVENGDTPIGVESELGGLAPDTDYYYRLQATNHNGSDTGLAVEDGTFHTPGPGIGEVSALEVSASSARLQASIGPDAESTSYRFEYANTPFPPSGAGPAGAVSLGEHAIGDGTQPVPVETTSPLRELAAGTTYYYRVVATSEIEPGVLEEFYGSQQSFLTQPASVSTALPDGRSWELVSPADKRGALISPIGEQGLVQAAADGDAISYIADRPTEAQPQGNAQEVQVLSTRSTSGWSSSDIALSHDEPVGLLVGVGFDYRFFSDDLEAAIAESLGPFSPPEGEHENAYHEAERVHESSPEATEATPYLRNDVTCASAPETCFTPLVTGAAEGADVPEGIEFGGHVQFVGATPSADFAVVDSTSPLTSATAPSGGLYLWSAHAPATQRLQLVSTLPEGEGEGAPSGAELGDYQSGPKFARNSISDEGTRVFFSARAPGQAQPHLYLRDTATESTIRLDLAEGGSPATQASALFQTASVTGTTAFFTDSAALTARSGTEGEDLYACEIAEVEEAGRREPQCRLQDLTPVPSAGQPGAGESAGVLGAVLGASEDGSYVYFVANGVQAPGASPGDCGGASAPAEATCNLYVAHDDDGAWTTRFIAALSGSDSPDWGASGFLTDLTARVSPNGKWLAFMSDRSLTGYDNRDAGSGEPDEEVYLYDDESAKLVCASCNPTGARPEGIEYAKLDNGLAGGKGVWGEGQWIAANVPGWTPYETGLALYQSRYLGDDGRLFFDSSDALSSQDTNGNEDVYEFEPPGVGSCTTAAATFGASANGCLSLISSGVAQGESVFLDASESGGDVFFLTAGQLVLEDLDTALDVYDAHECSALSPCAPAAGGEAQECRSAAECRAAPPAQPTIFGPSGSATFSGPGNPTTAAPATTKTKTKTKGKAKHTSSTRAKRLAAALAACRTGRTKRHRAACQRVARRRFGATKRAKRASRSTRSRRSHPQAKPDSATGQLPRPSVWRPTEERQG